LFQAIGLGRGLSELHTTRLVVCMYLHTLHVDDDLSFLHLHLHSDHQQPYRLPCIIVYFLN
jgi:hypothetical protein